MARLFLAIWVPENVISSLRELHRKDQRGVRFVEPDDWHVTLRFFGEADARDVVDALADTAFPSANAVLGPAVDVLDERVLAVPVAGLDEIAAVVDQRTQQIGTKPPRKRFVGHLTIARVMPQAPMPRALGSLINDDFEVTEIALVQSRLGSGRAHYETLETFPVG